MKKENIFSLALLVIVGVLVAVSTVKAATTISTNIVTDGTASIGSSTPVAQTLFGVGTSTSIFHIDKETGYIGLGKSSARAPLDFYNEVGGPAGEWGPSNGAGIIFSGANVELDGLMDFTAGAHGSCTGGSCAQGGLTYTSDSGGWLMRGEANRWHGVPNGASYTVDIGASYPVKAIAWGTYWKNSIASQFDAYTIEYSTNGTDWTTWVNITGNVKNQILHYLGDGINMRYVRITNTGTATAYVSNLQILGYVKQSPFSNQPFGIVLKNWDPSFPGSENIVMRTRGGLGLGTSTIPYKLTVDENKTYNNTNILARFQLSSPGATSTAPQVYFGAHDASQNMRNIAGVGGIFTDITTGSYKGALGFYTANNSTPSEVARITSAGNLGIGTTTPTTQLQVTASASNATSTITVGKVGQNKGSCLELFDAVGTAYYLSVVGGVLQVTTTSCK